MRFRFTIRDLLWLTALVAMGVDWWLDCTQVKFERDWYRRKLSPEWAHLKPGDD